MSDFDKEAERERLREKYEQEQTDREATERMSELLLKGATMTNAHCSDCGDPIFRYDGQEFCATCERAIDREDDTGNDVDDAGDGQPTDDEERIEVATPSEETRVQFGADASDDQSAGSDRATADRSENADGDGPHSGPQERAPSTRAERDRTESPRADHEHEHEHEQADSDGRDRTRTTVPSVEPAASRSDTGGGLAEARDSLARTLARLTRQAEAADDPAQARESLEAAREAAEALAALRR
jgi:uncharacterized Zn finger protein (UPF0148 family)